MIRRIWLGLVLAAGLRAQTGSFQLLAVQTDVASTISNGGALTFSTEVGQTSTGQVIATYRGAGSVSLQAPTLFGSSAFTFTTTPNLPATLTPGGTVTFNFQFKPTSSSPVIVQFSAFYTETIVTSVTGSGQPTTTTNTSSISLTLQGGAPSYVLSYVLQSDLNAVPLAGGGSIVFPPTQVTTTAQALFRVGNGGSGTGTVKSVSIQGDAFRLSGLPLFPASLPSGQQLSLNLTYSPQSIQSDTGTIQVSLGNGSSLTINLQGSGTGSSFSYSIVTAASTTALTPNGSGSLPDTALGDTSSAVIQVRNTGNGAGQINSILLLGTGFQIPDLPAVPATIAPQGTLTFTVTFAPIQAGASTAQLRIGSDSFTLSARGIGSRLVYSYTLGSSVISVAPGGAVIFSPGPIGQAEKIPFTIRNLGTQAAVLANIGLTDTKSAFSISGLPALPATVEANGELDFTISFVPSGSGFSGATLIIDSASFALAGSGLTPPPLPAYSIQGPSGTVGPLSQPAFGITLASPYSLTVSGVLTLNIAGDAAADPSVQFSTGGQSVAFVIPANSTSAIFPNQSTQIRLQTGTVASAVTLVPSFSVGGTDLTPNPVTVRTIAVPAAAPSLLVAGISNRTTSGFTLSVTGFSSTRSLTNLNLTFTPASGFNLATTQATLNIAANATLWFGSSASQAFGGQFTVDIPFSFQSSSSSVNALNALQAISVTASNEQGASNALKVSVQ